jgi:hypothetical protein
MGRFLVETVISKDDPILKDLYEIDYDLGDYHDGLSADSTVRAYINLQR